MSAPPSPDDRASQHELSLEEAIIAAQDEAPSATGADSLEVDTSKRPAGEASSQGSATMVNVAILLSRVVGLVRQRMTAHYFGTSDVADVITAAFRIGNITQNLLGEGTLSASFIPVYSKLRAKDQIDASRRFALSSLGLLLLVAIACSILGILFAPWLTTAVAAGFDPARHEDTADMLRVLFPMTGVLVLSAWGLGVLNSHRRFFLPYAAPVLWSLAQMAGLYVFGTWLHQSGASLAMTLAWSALIGGGLQLLVLLPVARSLLGRLTPSFDTRDRNVREAARRLPAVLLGRGVIQISGFIDNALVSFLPAGALSAFGYAQSLYLLPMSVLGTGEAAVALPEMAEDDAEENREKRNAAIRARLGSSLARVTTLTIPTSLAFLFLGRELITSILKSGHFDAASTARVVPLIAAYSFALLGNASGRVLTTTAYAIGDVKTPARYAIYRVVASAIGALVLMRFFDEMGVVLGAVIAAWVETIALGYKLRGQIGGLGLDAVPILKIAALGAASIAPPMLLKLVLPETFLATFLGATIVLVVFAGAFSIAAPMLGLFDLRSLLRRGRRASSGG